MQVLIYIDNNKVVVVPRIRPNLRNVVYSVGVKYADEQTWTEVFRRFQAEKVATEKRKLMYALTSSRNPGILKR